MTHWRRRQTGRQAFSWRVIDSSSVRVEERLTDNGVVVVQVFGEPLLGNGLLIELDVSLCEEVVVGLTTCGGEVVVLGTDSSAAVRMAVVYITSRKVKSRRKCWKLKMMKRRKVKWMEKSKRESLNVCMRHGCDREMEWETNVNLEPQCDVQGIKRGRHTTDEQTKNTHESQVLFSWVCTCFSFASTLNMLLCLSFCFVSLIQSSSVFPRTHFSSVCEFLVIPSSCSHCKN